MQFNFTKFENKTQKRIKVINNNYLTNLKVDE